MALSIQHLKEVVLQVAWSLHGTPYIWGGDDPMRGFDCSGFCIEVLRSVGLLPRQGDWTAQALYDLFEQGKVSMPYAGCLAFWHSPANTNRIVHVELCINEGLTMGASGGGSATGTLQDAIDQNAYIKVRPIRHPNLACVCDPFKLMANMV